MFLRKSDRLITMLFALSFGADSKPKKFCDTTDARASCVIGLILLWKENFLGGSSGATMGGTTVGGVGTMGGMTGGLMLGGIFGDAGPTVGEEGAPDGSSSSSSSSANVT